MDHLALSLFSSSYISLKYTFKLFQLLSKLLVDPLLQFDSCPSQRSYLVSYRSDFTLQSFHLIDYLFLKCKNSYILSKATLKIFSFCLDQQINLFSEFLFSLSKSSMNVRKSCFHIFLQFRNSLIKGLICVIKAIPFWARTYDSSINELSRRRNVSPKPFIRFLFSRSDD